MIGEKQSFTDELKDRVAEFFPATLVTRLASTRNLIKVWKDANDRVCSDHARDEEILRTGTLKALPEGTANNAVPGEKDMSWDIYVIGDIEQSEAGQKLKVGNVEMSTDPKKTPSKLPSILALGAAILGTSGLTAGAILLSQYLLNKPSAPEPYTPAPPVTVPTVPPLTQPPQPIPSWKLGVKVHDHVN